MLFKAASLAVLALAAQAVAEDMTFKMSARELFGIMRRQGENGGYEPTQTFCGTGTTCAEACGKGFNTCQSTDNAIHCYNSDAKQTCCSDGSGKSCDAGFYCASSTGNGTLCCPDGQSLEECAKLAHATGTLVSEAPAPTVYPTKSKAPSSSTSCTSTYAASMTYPASNTTKTYPTSSPTQVAVSGAKALAPGVAILAAAVFAVLL